MGSGNCLVVFHSLFSPFQSLFKLHKISLKFMFTSAFKSRCTKLLFRATPSKDATETKTTYSRGVTSAEALVWTKWIRLQEKRNKLQIIFGTHVKEEEGGGGVGKIALFKKEKILYVEMLRNALGTRADRQLSASTGFSTNVSPRTRALCCNQTKVQTKSSN